MSIAAGAGGGGRHVESGTNRKEYRNPPWVILVETLSRTFSHAPHVNILTFLQNPSDSQIASLNPGEKGSFFWKAWMSSSRSGVAVGEE